MESTVHIRAVWILGLAVATVLLFPGASPVSEAGAAEGDIAFDSCLTATNEPQKPTGTTCSDFSAGFTSLTQPTSLTAADNGSVYVTGVAQRAVTQLVTAPNTGELTLLSCVEGSPTGDVSGCDDLGTDTFVLPSPVDATTVGNDVYIADFGSDSVVHLKADATGELTFADCLTGDPAITDCGDLSGSTNALDSPTRVATSPDGKNVYLGSANTSTVINLARADDGTLSFADCLTGGQFSPSTTGCNSVYDDTRSISPGSIEVDPGGDFVYLTGATPNDTVVQLTRGAGGTLGFDQCLHGPAATSGCDSTTAETNALDQPNGVVAAGAGHVYVTASLTDSIIHFARDENGELAIADCITGDPATTLCEDVSDPPESTTALDSARSVQLSQTGEFVLAVGSGSSSVSSFSRAPSGKLTFGDCVTSSATATGCSENISADTNVLDSASRISVASDGASVFGIGDSPDMAFRLSRVPEEVPETTITSGPTGITEDHTPTFAFESDLASTTFTCSTDDGPPFACVSPTTLATLPSGKHTFSVYATKSTGTVDPTPAEADFEVTDPVEPPVEPPIGPPVQPPIGPPVQPPIAPPADTTAPKLTLKARKLQRRPGRVTLKVTCDEACTVVVAGKVKVPRPARRSPVGGSKTYRFRPGKFELGAGSTRKVKLKLGKRPAKAIRRILKRGKKLRVRLSVSVADSAGNRSSAKRKLQLRKRRR